jgi:hypothetical protein
MRILTSDVPTDRSSVREARPQVHVRLLEWNSSALSGYFHGQHRGVFISNLGTGDVEHPRVCLQIYV